MTRTLSITAAAALAGAALVFSVAPSVATARQPRPAPRTRIDSMEVEAKLAQTDTGWAIDVEVANPTNTARPCHLSLALTRRVSNPMARVMSVPRRLWELPVAMELPANGRVQRRVELPENIAKDLTAVEVSAAKEPDELSPQLASTVEFAVVVSKGGAKAATAQGAAPVRLASAAK